MKKIVLVAFSLFIFFMILVLGILAVLKNNNLDLINNFNLDNKDYRFPESKEYKYNFENDKDIISITTDKRFILSKEMDDFYYVDSDGESEFIFKFYTDDNMDLNQVFNYMLEEISSNGEELIIDTLENGFKYAEYIINEEYFASVVFEYNNRIYSTSFICNKIIKDKYANSFKKWIDTISFHNF